MKTAQISITGMASVSPLGADSTTIWQAYLQGHSFLKVTEFDSFAAPVGALAREQNDALEALRNSDPKYRRLDRSVLLALYTSRKALSQVTWDKEFGVNIGSSRGATALFENYYDAFQKDPLAKTATLTSPTTTLGNIASWVAHDLQATGPAISHSITCSTALHALLNGVAWLRSGMSNAFLVGGTEAANTPFTIAQMKALKIYAPTSSASHPCRALDLEKKENTMVLGEGAASFCLERGPVENPLAVIRGMGYATEILTHNISISSEANCFQKSMQMALEDAGLQTVDAVVMHAPGTIKGDMSEYKALQAVFGNRLPALTSNKWKIGHTLGASGALSLELAVLMLQHQQFIPVPYLSNVADVSALDTVMVNAVGFGGNAVSILLSKK